MATSPTTGSRPQVMNRSPGRRRVRGHQPDPSRTARRPTRPSASHHPARDLRDEPVLQRRHPDAECRSRGPGVFNSVSFTSPRFSSHTPGSGMVPPALLKGRPDSGTSYLERPGTVPTFFTGSRPGRPDPTAPDRAHNLTGGPVLTPPGTMKRECRRGGAGNNTGNTRTFFRCGSTNRLIPSLALPRCRGRCPLGPGHGLITTGPGASSPSGS
jgi:hypothetical protein